MKPTTFRPIVPAASMDVVAALMHRLTAQMQSVYLIAALWAIFCCVPRLAYATPVIIANPGPNAPGVTTDLFDVAQDTIVTSASAQYDSPPFPGTSDPRSTFGYINANFIEPDRTIFADTPAVPTDFINFQTAQPINLGSFDLILAMDNPNRAADAFRLYASSNSADVQTHLVSSCTIPVPYPGSDIIEIIDSLNLSNVQFFRMEIDRATFSGFSGPRVIELDGFSPVPEPSTLVLTALGFLGLVAWGRQRSGCSAKQ